MVDVMESVGIRRFSSKEILTAGSRITPLAWPDLEIDVAELIPSR